MNTVNKFVLVWALTLTAFILMGVMIPHTFMPGTPISSAEMNANFDAVKTAVDALEAHMAALESGLSPGQIQYAKAQGLEASYVEATTGMRFVLIPPGEFQMGSPTSEADRSSDETLHHVRLTQAFYLSAHEVTNAQYRLKEAAHASTFDGDRRPVTEVSHGDAIAFADWLSTESGDTYQLPTEAQWEYACRAGTTTPFSFGPTINPAQVNYNGNAPYGGAAVGPYRAETTDVGILPANAWGLHDMHGNVYEWCQDRYGEYESSEDEKPVVDPQGPSTGTDRVRRGGCWVNAAQFCRSAYRGRDPPGLRYYGLGFRLALVPSSSQPEKE